MGGIKKLLPWLACIAADLLVVIGVWSWGYHRGKAAAGKATVVKTDTVTVKEPLPTKEGKVGVVTVPVHIETVEPQEPADIPGNSIVIFKPRSVGDSAVFLSSDSTEDTLRAVVPITQKEYRDSDYSAWVSGYMPKLDSIRVYRRTQVRTQTLTKYRRLNVGLTGGYGYGFVSHRLEPFVGVGVTWNIFR